MFNLIKAVEVFSKVGAQFLSQQQRMRVLAAQIQSHWHLGLSDFFPPFNLNFNHCNGGCYLTVGLVCTSLITNSVIIASLFMYSLSCLYLKLEGSVKIFCQLEQLDYLFSYCLNFPSQAFIRWVPCKCISLS